MNAQGIIGVSPIHREALQARKAQFCGRKKKRQPKQRQHNGGDKEQKACTTGTGLLNTITSFFAHLRTWYIPNWRAGDDVNTNNEKAHAHLDSWGDEGGWMCLQQYHRKGTFTGWAPMAGA